MATIKMRVAEQRRLEYLVDTGKVLTIQVIAEEALLEVIEVDCDGNKLGYPYHTIIKKILEYFPEARTTSRSLAWYASKMRSAGLLVPFRPRAKYTRKEGC